MFAEDAALLLDDFPVTVLHPSSSSGTGAIDGDNASALSLITAFLNQSLQLYEEIYCSFIGSVAVFQNWIKVDTSVSKKLSKFSINR